MPKNQPQQQSPQQRAASLIVDLTDRVPTSTEIDVVLAALRDQGSGADVVRTLAYSPRSHLSGGGDAAPWEEEVFRFLLRSPVEGESARILEVLGGIPEAERRRWLLLTLASLPEYQTY